MRVVVTPQTQDANAAPGLQVGSQQRAAEEGLCVRAVAARLEQPEDDNEAISHGAGSAAWAGTAEIGYGNT